MITAKISGTRITDQLEQYKRNLRNAGRPIMQRIGRLVAVSCADSSQPFGFGEGARKQGEHATAIDILRVYLTPSRVYNTFPDKRHAALFWGAIQKRNYAQAQQIVNSYHATYRGVSIQAFDGGTAHKAARSAAGRVSKKQRPVMIVQTPRNLFSYLDKEVQHVGEGKAGWAACAKGLGSMRGIPQWVTRHAGKGFSTGEVYENYSGTRFVLRMTSNVPYASQILRAGAKTRAVQIGFDRYLRGLGGAILRGRLPTGD